MADIEKIIDKIRKVLELSKNNPSEEEAKSAALKAQKLMAQYHISLQEVESVEDIDEITEKKVVVGVGNKWKYSLAHVVSRNFRCKHYLLGKEAVVFYGHDVDASIAMETFKMLFESGNKLSTSFYNKKRKEHMDKYGFFNGRGVKNDYLGGYTEGIRSVLEKQCTDLMIVIPEDVKASYAERSKKFRKTRSTLRGGSCFRDEARSKGYEAGREAIENRRLSVG